MNTLFILQYPAPCSYLSKWYIFNITVKVDGQLNKQEKDNFVKNFMEHLSGKYSVPQSDIYLIVDSIPEVKENK